MLPYVPRRQQTTGSFFQDIPAAFNRVVFAKVLWIIRQTYGEVRSLDKPHQVLHELGVLTTALRTVVRVDEQGRFMGKALYDSLPPVDQATHHAIAGHGWHVTPYKKRLSEAARKIPTDVTHATG
jgi:hypothetical protein